jgi:uncharacterized protein YbbK (DUF523 family)
MKIVVSACLLGRNCKYNGGNNYDEKVVAFLEGKEVIEVCPEVLAGLGVPRTPIEIRDGEVVSRDGNSVDTAIRAAVAQVLQGIRDEQIECCILKSRSPTCGVHQIYDGTFSGTLIDGAGVLAQALKEAGYRVLDDEDLQS